jgi:hypothetical protein
MFRKFIVGLILTIAVVAQAEASANKILSLATDRWDSNFYEMYDDSRVFGEWDTDEMFNPDNAIFFKTGARLELNKNGVGYYYDPDGESFEVIAKVGVVDDKETVLKMFDGDVLASTAIMLYAEGPDGKPASFAILTMPRESNDKMARCQQVDVFSYNQHSINEICIASK